MPSETRQSYSLVEGHGRAMRIERSSDAKTAKKERQVLLSLS